MPSDQVDTIEPLPDGGGGSAHPEPSASSAWIRRRSGGVRTSSDTGQAAAESLGRRQLQSAQGMIDVPRIETRMGVRDRVRPAPQ